jgi:8-oxo-dGTP pyrophosphatase MutT (NUDIX family)
MNDRVPEQQYGALPWRRVAGIEILLITSRETQRWVIPKGWPMEEHTDAEAAAQEAYEEAGIKGSMATAPAGFYTYAKRVRGGGKTRCRVDVFTMEVTEILDLWPEAHQRRRQWFSPQVAASHVNEPQLAEIIREVAAGLSGQGLPVPTYLQAVWRQLARVLRLLGLQ